MFPNNNHVMIESCRFHRLKGPPICSTTLFPAKPSTRARASNSSTRGWGSNALSEGPNTFLDAYPWLIVDVMHQLIGGLSHVLQGGGVRPPQPHLNKQGSDLQSHVSSSWQANLVNPQRPTPCDTSLANDGLNYNH